LPLRFRPLLSPSPPAAPLLKPRLPRLPNLPPLRSLLRLLWNRLLRLLWTRLLRLLWTRLPRLLRLPKPRLLRLLRLTKSLSAWLETKLARVAEGRSQGAALSVCDLGCFACLSVLGV
jgi:hypothetical protein